jgi:hypothetical protein
VSLDDLQEKIAEFEDYVQSSDVAAMQSMWLGYSRFLPHQLMHGICQNSELLRVETRETLFVVFVNRIIVHHGQAF